MPDDIEPNAGLWDIDWSELAHSYGKATNTPQELERLGSPELEVRSQALTSLLHSLYHQSGGYSASPVGLRFLLAHLRGGTTPRPRLLHVICMLGDPGGAYWQIASGVVEQSTQLARWYGEESLEHFAACRVVFVEAADTFLALLEDPLEEVRAQAAYALAWIPERAAESIAKIQARYDRETAPKVQMSSLLALGVLSLQRPKAEQKKLTTWLERHQPQRDPVLAAHSIARLYVRYEPPDQALLESVTAVLRSPPDVYPFPWWSGDLDGICMTLLRELGSSRGWSLTEYWNEMLNKSVDDAELQGEFARALIKTLFPKKIDTVDEMTPQQRQFVESLARRPQLFALPSGHFATELTAAGLEGGLRQLCCALGWVEQSHVFPQPMPVSAQVEDSALAERLPAPLLATEGLDLVRMLCNFYPFDGPLICRVQPLLREREQCPADPDPLLLNRNEALRLEQSDIQRFEHSDLRWRVAKDPSILWTRSLIERYRETVPWKALSTRVDLNWTEDLIEHYAEQWDWSELSRNEGLPWSEALIERYEEEWTWHLLSENPSLPWSESLLQRYEDWYWDRLSANSGLPWSESFFERYQARLDPCRFGQLKGFPWTESWIAAHAGWLRGWSYMSANPSLPWSEAFIRAYAKHWDWEKLSMNPHLPWSRALYDAFVSDWRWPQILRNPAVPWDELESETVAENVSAFEHWSLRYERYLIPWSSALLEDRRMQHLFHENDRNLYERYFAPHLNDSLVVELLARAALRRGALALEALEQMGAASAEAIGTPALLRALGFQGTIKGVEVIAQDRELKGLRDPARRLLASPKIKALIKGPR